MDRRFPIAELRTLVARALSQGYSPAESGRVRAVPDTRTIRYYTTLGLVDGPAEMRGRTAFYTDRHVLQVVAIKRLQGQGHSLAAVQQQLVGLLPEKLSQVAALPDGFWEAADRYLARQSDETVDETKTPPVAARAEAVSDSAVDSAASVEGDQERSAESFWTAAPQLPPSQMTAQPESSGSSLAASDGPPATDRQAARFEDNGRAAWKRVLKVPLGGGASLRLELPLAPDDGERLMDIPRLRRAAEPLIHELVQQGVLPYSNEDPPRDEP